MQARSVASKTARQLDSVILCVARFKNFNSQTAVQLSAQTMRPAYENSRVFCCAKLLPACCKPKASRLAAVCQAAGKQQINFVFHLFSIYFFNWFPCLSLSLSCSHKMFALFGAFCLLLLQATLTPAQVSLAKLRARITCLHFQKVDRPKHPPPSTTICWSILLVAWFVLFAKYRKYFNYRVGFKLKLCSRLTKRGEPE